MEQTLAIAYTLPDSAGIVENIWLRMEQVDAGDDNAVSVGEAAAVIDALYGRDPCVDESESGGEEAELDEEGQPVPPVSEQEFVDIVASMLHLNLCDLGPDLSYEAQLKIFRSHLALPYVLRIDNGEATATTTVEEQISDYLAVDGDSAVNLSGPVVGNAVFAWSGAVYGDAGPISPPPEITLAGATLNFGRNVTGRVAAQYLTSYDLVTVLVNGPPSPGSNEEQITEAQPATAVAFYEGLAIEQEIEPPAIEDEEDEDSETLLCGGEHLGDDDDDEEPPPEEDIPEDQCLGEGTLDDPEYYELICCDPPERALPRCATSVTVYRGGMGIAMGAAAAREIYGANARLIPVAPKKGYCGEFRTEQVVRQLNCCLGVPALAWDFDKNPETMAPSSNAWIYVLGGEAPYHWDLGGQMYALVKGLPYRTVTTSKPYLHVYTTADACGTMPVYVGDLCSSVRGYIRATVGQWVLVTSQWPGGCPATSFTRIYLGASGFFAEGVSEQYIVLLPMIQNQFCVSPHYICDCADYEAAAIALDAQSDCIGIPQRCLGTDCHSGDCAACWSVSCYTISGDVGDHKRKIFEWMCP